MTKITQLPADTTPTGADLIALVENATTTTKRMTLANLSAIMSTLLLPSGMVMPYAGTAAPSSWLLCDGSAISRTTYSTLYAIVGTTYGTGNGSTTFNLPDLRGRVVAGKDNMGGTAASRMTGTGTASMGSMDGTVLGNTGGNELHWHWQTFGYDGSAAYFAVTGAASALGANSHSTVITATRGISFFGNSSTAARFDGSGDSTTIQPTIILNYIIKT